jgi:hypothetical protein
MEPVLKCMKNLIVRRLDDIGMFERIDFTVEPAKKILKKKTVIQVIKKP